jgi:Ca2+-binding RTX toxin-like protein
MFLSAALPSLNSYLINDRKPCYHKIRELVFIDTAIPEYQCLASGVIPGVEVILLDADQDGMTQITTMLQSYGGCQSIDRLHLVSHGQLGQIELGTAVLTLDRLQTYGADLRQWRQALSSEATVLIYGCEVAGGSAGMALIQQISQWLSVPVAASDRLVGSASQGGSWELAVQTAEMDIRPVFQATVLESYAHVLSSEIRIGDASVIEGNDGSKNLTFTVFLNTGNSTETITVDYATEDDNATAGVDYTPISGTLSFLPGETAKTITVTIAGDTVSEASELFFLNLSNPSSNAILVDQQGIGIILNDDPLPVVNVDDVSLIEGDSGTTQAEFTISLSAASDQFVSINFKTTDDTAQADSDYTKTTGRLIFSPGETTKTVLVPILADRLDEIDEAFWLELSGAKNAKLGDGRGIGTIADDDLPPSVSVSNIKATEGENATFTVSLSVESGKEITIDYTLIDGTATIGEQDFAADIGKLVFAPGETTKTVVVPILEDNLYEQEETFSIQLSNPAQVTLGTSQATATLTDNDPAPQISIADAELIEADNGSQSLIFTLTLSNASSQPVRVNYAATDGTAMFTEDYSLTPGQVTFAPGQTSQTVSVTVNGDRQYELDETFEITLSDPIGGALLKDTATGTIRNNDPLPAISIQDHGITEGDGGVLLLNFTVSLSNPSDQLISVQYSTANDTATDSDFTAVLDETLYFAPGETTQTIAIEISGDTADEAIETFQVNLTNPTNATLADAQAIGTITDNDGVPTLSIADIQPLEGDNGSLNAIFTVTLSNPSHETITVNYATIDGTAKVSANDYQQVSGTLTFTPGQTTQTILVPIIGDQLTEPNETFKIGLSALTNATFANDSATATIRDNDAALTASVTDIEVLEGDNGIVNAIFTVNLSRSHSQSVTIGYATENGTATVADGDYQATMGSVVFAAGETRKTIAVPVRGDRTIEPDEKFKLNLTSSDLVFTDAQGVATISNDDVELPLPSLTVQGLKLLEGNRGGTEAQVTVSLSAASPQQVSVEYETQDGTATVAKGDYRSIPRSVLTFAPGETRKTITLTIEADTLVEPDETFILRFFNPTQATLAQAQTVITIENDDQNPGANEPAPSAPVPTDPDDNRDTGADLNPPLTQQIGSSTDDQMIGTDGNDLMRGGSGNDLLSAGEGQDRLFGEAGDDQLFGGRDGDFLSGGPGNDQLFGGRGNDRLTGDAGDDELYGRGGDDLLMGKAGTDFLAGGRGDDLLIGGMGNDRLRGAQGQDRFIFLSPLEKQDRILDFSLGQDQIGVSARGFKAGLKVGPLEQSQFHLGSRAESTSDRLLYESKTGQLYFDADGTGSAARVLIAQLAGAPKLSSQSILIVA